MTRPLFLGIAMFVLASCSLFQGDKPSTKPGTALDATSPEITDLQRRLAKAAESLQGKSKLSFDGNNFSFDCTGTVLAAYYLAGHDLRKDFARYPGGGVQRLYRMAEERALLSLSSTPLPGDVLFWDNTYDRNKDGRWNDELTHTGIVVRIGEDGTIYYLHHHVTRGIVVEAMNLDLPDVHESARDGKTALLNSPIRIREAGKPRPKQWLAGQLYNAYGRLWKLRISGS